MTAARAQLVLANTGESSMTWYLNVSAADPGEVTWVATPDSGTIEPFGEIVVGVVALTPGLNARQAAYTAMFDIHSDDVCVCRDQTVEMAIELVVTAETSAANSYVRMLGAANAEAAGELNFHIVPVDKEGLLVQDSGAVQFSPMLTWVGYQKQAVRRSTRRRPLEEVVQEVVVVCSVKYLSAIDTHVGSCRMPTLDGVPLAGSFSLSVELASGELVGGSEYSVEVASCPEFWFYHKISGACIECDLDKSVCRGGKELPVPKKGFWSDLENAELGYAFFVCVVLVGATTRDLSLLGTFILAIIRKIVEAGSTIMVLASRVRPALTRARPTYVLSPLRARSAASASGRILTRI